METTNFFSKVAALNITGDLQLTIRKGTENNCIVSVMLHNEQCGDDARKLIPPLNLKGTVNELDEGFFERITTPLQSASGLIHNMEAFMKQLEEAKKQSAMEKEKTDKEKKAKEEKEKKFKEAMAKANELEKEGSYRDAWMKVPDPAQFPGQAEVIRKRKTALSAKFAPDLFGAPETVRETTEPQEENTLHHEVSDNERNCDEVEDNWEDDCETE
ncbi:MAG: prtrc system protein e [Bacteroidetes bacterium 46-16]|nr:MAG: prtrc system protein e [Bacteroidetes bacterium 46-16]